MVTLADVRRMNLPAVLPADLLGRRADIEAARWRVEAATRDTEAARAQFYPNINLNAFVGLSSIGLGELLKSDSRQIGFGPAIHLPIFDAGRLRANLQVGNADLDLAVESYNAVVRDGVRDAVDQLGSLQSLARQQHEQAAARAAAESAYDLVSQRYKAGLATYLAVLNAESQLLGQRRLAADLTARVLDRQVALVRALGGGYSSHSDVVAATGGQSMQP
jgi:NodT family efflux transporter outer membrane factor (OMF) lipoprotein